MVIGLGNVTRYPHLFAELLRRGYSDEDVLKIAGRNHLRAMHRMERVAAELQKIEPPLITEGLKKRRDNPRSEHWRAALGSLSCLVLAHPTTRGMHEGQGRFSMLRGAIPDCDGVADRTVRQTKPSRSRFRRSRSVPCRTRRTPDRQRGEGRVARRLRRLGQAACHYRVGVKHAVPDFTASPAMKEAAIRSAARTARQCAVRPPRMDSGLPDRPCLPSAGRRAGGRR